MWLINRTETPDREPNQHRLVVTLNVREGCTPFVRSSELIGQDFRIRTSFTEDIPIDEVLIKPIADKIKACLGEAGTQTELKFFPDMEIAIPGLSLSGISAMTSRNEDNTLHVIVRFQHFEGTFNRVFLKNLKLGDTLDAEIQNLETPGIADLATPLLNICEAAKLGLSTVTDPSAAQSPHLVEHAGQIAAQIDYIEQMLASLDSANVITGLSETRGKVSREKIASSSSS